MTLNDLLRHFSAKVYAKPVGFGAAYYVKLAERLEPCLLQHKCRQKLVLLPPDAVRWRGICYGNVAVCLFCMSVTLMYCAQTTESIIVPPSPDCSPAILVFTYQISARQLEGIHGITWERSR